MISKNERELSIYILKEVFREDAYSNIVLRRTLEKNKELNNIQKSFITELVNGTLRNLIYINYIIDTFSKVNTQKLKPFILYLFQISVFQIVFMDKIPISAVCNEAVKLCKLRGFKNLSGYVNGVTRNIARNKDNIILPDKKLQPIKYLSIRYSHPEWIINYWLEEMSIQEIESILINNNKSPKVTICVNKNKITKDELENNLIKENIIVKQGNLSKNALIISNTGNIKNNLSYKEGLFHVMDESSMIAVEVANPKKGDFLIDACSAPGGKSFYSSYLMQNEGKIISTDIYEHKINIIIDNAKRLNINIIDTKLQDSSIFDKSLEEQADILLLDVPCSGLGLIRKKPDIKIKKSLEDINSLVAIQRNILKACYRYVKKGGVLVYSTCTISKKENLDNINWFLHKYKFELETINLTLNECLKSITTSKGYLQILPSSLFNDGFFIAKMIRRE